MEQSKPWDLNNGDCSCDPDNLGSLSRYLHLQVLGSSLSVSLCLYSSLYLYYIYIHNRFKYFLWSCIWIYLYLYICITCLDLLIHLQVQGSSLLETTSPWTPSCGQESDLRRICRDLPSNWGGVWIRSSLSSSQVQDRNVDYYGQIGRSAVAQLSDRNSQYYSGEWKPVSGYNFAP